MIIEVKGEVALYTLPEQPHWELGRVEPPCVLMS